MVPRRRSRIKMNLKDVWNNGELVVLHTHLSGGFILRPLGRCMLLPSSCGASTTPLKAKDVEINNEVFKTWSNLA